MSSHCRWAINTLETNRADSHPIQVRSAAKIYLLEIGPFSTMHVIITPVLGERRNEGLYIFEPSFQGLRFSVVLSCNLTSMKATFPRPLVGEVLRRRLGLAHHHPHQHAIGYLLPLPLHRLPLRDMEEVVQVQVV